MNELYGPKHQPSDSDHFRAGSSSGRVLLEGERESLVRPRVRKRTGDTSSEEVVLSTYESARDPSQLQDSILGVVDELNRFLQGKNAESLKSLDFA